MFSYRILIVFSPIFYNCFLIEKLLYFHRWFCAENTMKIQAVFLKYCHNTIYRRNLRNIHVVFLSYFHKLYVSWEYNDNPMRIRRKFRDDFRWDVNQSMGIQMQRIINILWAIISGVLKRELNEFSKKNFNRIFELSWEWTDLVIS